MQATAAAQYNPQKAPEPESPMASTLGALHAELNDLEQVTMNLVQRLHTVTEPASAGNQTAQMGAVPGSSVVGSVQAARSRVQDVRLVLVDLISRLHV